MRGIALAQIAWVLACGRHVDVLAREDGSGSADGETSTASTTSAAETATSSDLPQPSACTVPLPTGVPPPCGPGSADTTIVPVLEWSWGGVGADHDSLVTPLVASLTDDDDSGTVDACDTPDVVVVAYAPAIDAGARVYVLDGATGALHTVAAVDVDVETTPALGDLDGDNVAEIVTVGFDGTMTVVAADGSLRTSGDPASGGAALAIADLDGDGTPEIVHPAGVYDADGRLMWAIDPPQNLVASDVDDDGELELVGGRGFRHDGTGYYDAGIPGGWPQVADLDRDSEPEIVVAHDTGLTILDHTGTMEVEYLYPAITPRDPVFAAPVAIHDFDGDGQREIAARTAISLLLLEADGQLSWMRPAGAGTAGPVGFDLLGAGAAMVLFADATELVAYDGGGTERFVLPRSSASRIELPVVADVDADGAAEIVIVNNETPAAPSARPPVQVYGDGTGGWVGTRRVWNQHAYAVTNVGDEGTIPSPAVASWRTTNTFRANARVEDGTICAP